MANTYLTRTNGSAVTAERRTFTISFWLKRSATGVQHALCSAGNGGGAEEFCMRIRDDNTLEVWHYDGSTFVGRKRTNRLFRDTNAYYHIFCQYDTTESTADDRIKLYINGIRETSFADSVNPTLNDNTAWNVDERHQIGSNSWGNSGNGSSTLDGCMSHFYNVAGSIIDISQFGSTDSTTGEWKINTSPTIASYGTAGFLVLKDGNTVTDQSPNSNNFTVGGGTLTKTEDCPDNVFATWNSLWSASNGNVGDVTFSNGNTTTITSVSYRTTPTTLGMKSGKYYWEVKRIEDTAGDVHAGVMSENATPANTATWIGNAANGWVVSGDAGQPYTGGTGGSIISNTAFPNAGDIHMCAYDGTTGKLYFGVNGTWGGTANPSTGANPHYTLDTSLFYFPCVSTGSDCSANFGNGYFGTTAVTTNSGNGYAGADGKSIFNYQPPTGYTALSTKGLNL